MNEDTLTKIVLIRYALIPRQLLSFDYGYTKDLYEYNKEILMSREKILSEIESVLNSIKSGVNDLSYEDKYRCIIKFGIFLPFIDMDLTQSGMDFLKDYPLADIDDFFQGRYIPDSMDSSSDEAYIFYTDKSEFFYSWYNRLDNKTLPKFVSLYSDLIKQI